MFMQTCSFLLLITAAQVKSNQPPAPKKQFIFNRLMTVPTDEWAMHDWVPEKNRVINEKGLPVGKGELEAVQNSRRKRPQYGPQRQHHLRRRLRPGNYKDLLKKQILENREQVMKMKKPSKLVRKTNHAMRHGKNKKRDGKVVRRRGNLRKKSEVKLFPKEFWLAEEARFRLKSDICSQTSITNKQLLLMPWWNQYCNPFEDKESKNNFHARIFMPKYRQVVENLQKYKDLMVERNRMKDLMSQLVVQ